MNPSLVEAMTSAQPVEPDSRDAMFRNSHDPEQAQSQPSSTIDPQKVQKQQMKDQREEHVRKSDALQPLA